MTKNYSYSWDVPQEKEETFLRLVARIESYMAENATSVDYYPNKIDWCPTIEGFVMYVLACRSKKAEITTYTGYSGSFKNRMLCHFNFLGGDFTKKHPPLYIAHHEVFATKKEAMDREREIKYSIGALNFIRNNPDKLKPIKP